MATKITPCKIYIRNRKRCGDKCIYPTCKATTDIEFALDISVPFEVYEPTGDCAQKGCFEE